MTVGHAVWPDQLDDAERWLLSPGIPPDLDRRPDVLVVGGGIVGCATAAACVRAGLGSVVLLERETLGAGASGGAAGILQPEVHVGVDPPAFVDFMRLSLSAWRELHTLWPGGVGLLNVRYKREPAARVNPLRAIARLAAHLSGIATGVDVTGVQTRDGRIEAVLTSAGAFHPGRVVFATGLAPVLHGLELNLPSMEVKGHMLCSAPTGLQPPTGVSDLVTVIEDGRLLMGGTLDLGDTARVVRPEVAARLWQELVEAWPAVAETTVEYTWACFRPAHADHLPVIDRVPGLQNAWLTSGQYKTGILCAPGTANALVAWMQSDSPPAEIAAFALRRLDHPVPR
jgi:glycine/D-amino acid oxidase-like deaminating enzyme